MPNERGERVLGDCWEILERHGIKRGSGYDRYDAFELAAAIERLEQQNAKLVEALKAIAAGNNDACSGSETCYCPSCHADNVLREAGAIQ